MKKQKTPRLPERTGGGVSRLVVHAVLFLVVFAAVLAAGWPDRDARAPVAVVLAPPADVAHSRSVAHPRPQPATAPVSGEGGADVQQPDAAVAEEAWFDPQEPVEVPLDEITGEPIVAELVRH